MEKGNNIIVFSFHWLWIRSLYIFLNYDYQSHTKKIMHKIMFNSIQLLFKSDKHFKSDRPMSV